MVIYNYGSVGNLVGIPTRPHGQFAQLINGPHLLLAQLKVKHLTILDNSLQGSRFRQHDETMLEGPSQADLSQGFIVLGSQASHNRTGEQTLIASRKRRVCLNLNLVFSAKLDGFLFPEKRVNFELVDGWLHI